VLFYMQVIISCHPYVINTMDFVKVSSNDANDTLVLILWLITIPAISVWKKSI
jgi:hypothetical protein